MRTAVPALMDVSVSVMQFLSRTKRGILPITHRNTWQSFDEACDQLRQTGWVPYCDPYAPSVIQPINAALERFQLLEQRIYLAFKSILEERNYKNAVTLARPAVSNALYYCRIVWLYANINHPNALWFLSDRHGAYAPLIDTPYWEESERYVPFINIVLPNDDGSVASGKTTVGFEEGTLIPIFDSETSTYVRAMINLWIEDQLRAISVEGQNEGSRK